MELSGQRGHTEHGGLCESGRKVLVLQRAQEILLSKCMKLSNFQETWRLWEGENQKSNRDCFSPGDWEAEGIWGE